MIVVKARKIKVIVLDLDGTLVESNHIKDQAFDTIFGDWPDHKETIMAWHLPRNTTDRGEKFRYFLEEILGQKRNRNLTVGTRILGITGRDGGYTGKVANVCLVIPTQSDDTITPHAEAWQAVIWHMLVTEPRIMAMSNKNGNHLI